MLLRKLLFTNVANVWWGNSSSNWSRAERGLATFLLQGIMLVGKRHLVDVGDNFTFDDGVAFCCPAEFCLYVSGIFKDY